MSPPNGAERARGSLAKHHALSHGVPEEKPHADAEKRWQDRACQENRQRKQTDDRKIFTRHDSRIEQPEHDPDEAEHPEDVGKTHRKRRRASDQRGDFADRVSGRDRPKSERKHDDGRGASDATNRLRSANRGFANPDAGIYPTEVHDR